MAEMNEDALWLITEQFVAALEAGQQPRLTDYVRRYPQYAHELVDFVTYYHGMEASLPQRSTALLEAHVDWQLALDQAWEKVTASPFDEPPLLALARQRGCPLPQLATALNLSMDIIVQLVYGQFDPATLPAELLQRLAHVLAQSLNQVGEALGASGPAKPHLLAEERSDYLLPPLPTFRQTLLDSEELSSAQRTHWLEILDRTKNQGAGREPQA